MTIAELPVVFREALALHDIIGAFGVPVDRIFVAAREGSLFVVAREDGCEAGFRVGELGPAAAAFEQEWNAAVAAYNASPRADRTRLLEASQVRDSAVTIIAGLVARGFKPAPLRPS